FVVVSVLGVSAQELEETYVFEETGTVIKRKTVFTRSIVFCFHRLNLGSLAKTLARKREDGMNVC
ncbi:MAG: hypothetical protein AAFN11_09485, partial [Chloroflexota bacterium]